MDTITAGKPAQRPQACGIDADQAYCVNRAQTSQARAHRAARALDAKFDRHGLRILTGGLGVMHFNQRLSHAHSPAGRTAYVLDDYGSAVAVRPVDDSQEH